MHNSNTYIKHIQLPNTNFGNTKPDYEHFFFYSNVFFQEEILHEFGEMKYLTFSKYQNNSIFLPSITLFAYTTIQTYLYSYH